MGTIIVTNSSAEVLDTQGHEKRHWPDDCAGPVKKIQKFKKTGSFDVQSGRGRKKIYSMVVEEVAAAVHEELSSGVKIGELAKHWTGL